MPITERTTGLLVNNSNQLDVHKYSSQDCNYLPVKEFVDGMGVGIRCTQEDQLILSIGPFKGTDLSKLMTFILVWTNEIPDEIEDHIKIKHLADGVEVEDDTMTITKSALSITHGDAIPFYFDPAKEHIIDILTTSNAVGYNLYFDYVQFNTMNINQINSSTLAGTSDKPLVNTIDNVFASPAFNAQSEITVTIPFNTEYADAPALFIQLYSSYFSIDITEISPMDVTMIINTGDGANFTGTADMCIIVSGVTAVPYVTKVVQYESQ